MKLLKQIPVWIKAPIAVFLKEVGKLPLSIVLCHMRKAYADAKPLDDVARLCVYQQYHATICDYLNKKYGKLLTTASKKYCDGVHQDDFPIWVFWWQGEENAPDIVRACIASIRQHAGVHPVHVLHAGNYRDYVSIPEGIINKVQNGIISVTHFSDILRMNLIAEHGGFWLDATIFCTKDIEGPEFAQPIFTIRNPGCDMWNVSRWEWSGFSIYGRKNGPLFCMMRDLLNAYWEDHDILLDYFLIDYGIRLVYEHSDSVQDAICSIPESNKNLYYFQENFCKPEYLWKTDAETWLYKLSWKTSYPIKTAEGETTVYAKWLAECLN